MPATTTVYDDRLGDLFDEILRQRPACRSRHSARCSVGGATASRRTGSAQSRARRRAAQHTDPTAHHHHSEAGRRTLCAYLRISFDPHATLAGVTRQREDVQRLADYLGVDVCWHEDNDTSAYTGQYRTYFESMLQHVEDKAHPSSGILTYNLDRLCRRVDDLVRVLALYEADPTRRFHAVGSSPDLSTTDGQAMATVMIAFAKKASDDAGRRVARWHLQRAKEGRQAGRSAFGWLPDKVKLDPVYGPILRQAGYDVLTRKRTTERVARDWNADGVKTMPRRKKLPDGTYTEPRSAPWSSRTVTQVLKNPRVGGFAVYLGDLYLDEDGNPVADANEPAMQPEDWLQLYAYLTSEERGAGVNTRAAENARRYMATSVLVCRNPKCRRKLQAAYDNRREHYDYACLKQEGRGCGQTRIDGPSMDAYLNAYVETILTAQEFDEYADEVEPWGGEAELREISERHAEAIDWYAGLSAPPVAMSRQTIVATVGKLETKLVALREEQARNGRARAAAARLAEASDLDRWRKAYAEQDWVTCRDALSAFVLEVLVTPKPRRGRRRKDEPVFDPTRVEIVARARV